MPVDHTYIDSTNKTSPDSASSPGTQALLEANRRANAVLDSRDTQSRNAGKDPSNIIYKK